MSPAALLELHNVSCFKDDLPVFKDVNLVINEGEVIILRGKSGSGKTTLLKCISNLILYDGQVLYRGSTAKAFGIPSFRTRVLYVPQRPSMLPGSPRDFLLSVTSLEAHKAHTQAMKKMHKSLGNTAQRAMEISKKWDVESQLWEREWSNLSGGEAQRIMLAIAVGLNTAEVILLDEPTSALDTESSSAVEKFMVDEIHSLDTTLKTIVWITHSDEQASRIGTRFINISIGRCIEEFMPNV